MRKNFVFGAVGVFLFFFIFSWQAARAAMMAPEENCVTSSAYSKILLNEFSSASSYDDWIEIYNLFDQCVDLSFFTLWDASESIKSFSSGSNILPGEYLLVDVNNRLNKSGDSVILKYEDMVWDSFEYGNSEHPVATDSQFWARVPDGGDWVLNITSTPGAANFLSVDDGVGGSDEEIPTSTVTTTENTTSTDETATSTTEFTTTTIDFSGLRLNEVFPDPEDGEEWVEIFNLGTSTLDFGGLRVCDNRLTVCKTASSSVAAGGWARFDLGSGFLNNSGDSAILKDNADNILDSVTFGEVGSGRSYARTIDGAGEWKITTVPTPGATNIIAAPVVSGGGSSHTNTQSIKTTESVAVVVGTSSFFGKVVINEIFPDPDGSDTTDESCVLQ